MLTSTEKELLCYTMAYPPLATSELQPKTATTVSLSRIPGVSTTLVVTRCLDDENQRALVSLPCFSTVSPVLGAYIEGAWLVEGHWSPLAPFFSLHSLSPSSYSPQPPPHPYPLPLNFLLPPFPSLGPLRRPRDCGSA